MCVSVILLDLAFYLRRKEIIIIRVTKAIENHRGTIGHFRENEIIARRC